MKILLVNKFHYRKGGSETYYFALADALRKLGHQVFFFAMMDDQNEFDKYAQYFVSAKDYNGPTSLWQKAKAAISLVYSHEAKEKFEALCCVVKPDIIHMNLVHRQITLSILDAPYIKKNRTPVVWTAHDYIAVCPNYTLLDGQGHTCKDCVSGHYLNCIKKKCVKASTVKSCLAVIEAKFLQTTKGYSKIDSIICPYLFLEKTLIEGGFSPDQLIYMPNFISDNVIYETNETPEIKLGDPYFIYFGRLSEEKGIEVLVKAFSKAQKDFNRDVKLVIVGDGPLRSTLVALAKDLDSESNITFLGYQSGSTLRSLIKGALFSVVPSIWYENMPFSILESFLAGTPVLGTNVGGIPEMVIRGSTGFTFPLGDIAALTCLLVKATSISEEAYREMQFAGMAYVKEFCSQTAYLKNLVDLYNNLIEVKKHSHEN